MAIQVPNPGTGNGASGDNEFVLWTKVKDNFTNTTHAASRLVGVETGQLMEVGAYGWGGAAAVNALLRVSESEDKSKNTEVQLSKLRTSSWSNNVAVGYGAGIGWRSGQYRWELLGSGVDKQFYIHCTTAMNSADASARVYSAHKVLAQGLSAFADGNGFWKTSSPVVRVYASDIDPNDDAEAQGVTYTRNGVGDYTLHNTLGLAQEGWQIELPQDNNRNPLVAIETEYTKEGDLIIRTYKRIFSMETFTFTCDFDNPLDIPDGRCVDVRLHELPKELPVMPTETQLEV